MTNIRDILLSKNNVEKLTKEFMEKAKLTDDYDIQQFCKEFIKKNIIEVLNNDIYSDDDEDDIEDINDYVLEKTQKSYSSFTKNHINNFKNNTLLSDDNIKEIIKNLENKITIRNNNSVQLNTFIALMMNLTFNDRILNNINIEKEELITKTTEKCLELLQDMNFT